VNVFIKYSKPNYKSPISSAGAFLTFRKVMRPNSALTAIIADQQQRKAMFLFTRKGFADKIKNNSGIYMGLAIIEKRKMRVHKCITSL